MANFFWQYFLPRIFLNFGYEKEYVEEIAILLATCAILEKI